MEDRKQHYKCPICGVSFPSKRSRGSHLRRHTLNGEVQGNGKTHRVDFSRVSQIVALRLSDQLSEREARLLLKDQLGE